MNSCFTVSNFYKIIKYEHTFTYLVPVVLFTGIFLFFYHKG
ncbi:hypothetical protein NY10_1536 [Carnobacterium antarcticum]|nr:hypothetical protein NY10_1536 [Carnobacterium sp. CP1]